MNTTDRKIIFVHQAKAAGTSVVEAFKATYGSGALFHDQDNQGLWKMAKWRRFIELNIQPYRKYKDRESYQVIHGHFRSAKYRRAFPGAFYLTFYRDPVQQIVSTYFFWLRSYNPTDTLPLRQWVYEVKPNLVEFVAKWIDGNDLEGRAKRLNTHNFNFVGITERLEDSMKLLKLHIPELVTDVEAHRANPDKQVGEGYILSHDDEEMLNKMLRPLIVLYGEALSRFESDWGTANTQGKIERN